jgi:mgtE-like transporter
MVPALLATRGNVYGSLGARLATALHQGLIRPRVRVDDGRLPRAVAAALANGLLASGFAALAAFLVLAGTGRCVAGPHVLGAVALLSGLLSGVALSTVVVVAVFVGFRRGYNPDTLVGPVVTTAGDVFGVAFLLLAARTVLLVADGGCW